MPQGYDTLNDSYKVESIQKKVRESFTSNLNNWMQTIGSGMTATVSGGQLTVTTGTTINSETILTYKDQFTVPCRAMFSVQLSQRIINQEFYFELCSVDPKTGLVDNQAFASWKLDGTVATNGAYGVQNGGLTPLWATGQVINTTQGQMHILEIELFTDECWFHSRQMDSAAGRSNSYVRHQQIPPPDGQYVARIRAKNLGTAPASTTSLTSQFLCVNDFAELTTEVVAGCGNVAQGQAMGVNICGTPSVSAAITNITAGTLTKPSFAHYNAANAGVQVGSAGSRTLFAVTIGGSSDVSTVYIYNNTSATTPVLKLSALANDTVTWQPPYPLTLGTGIFAVITGTSPYCTVTYS